MNRIEGQAAFARMLMDRVREDTHPSPAQMTIIEQLLPAELVPEYLEILVEKVTNDRWPSVPMMQRIQRVIEAMPASEGRGQGRS
jgi:hypothetical protein